MRAHVFSLSGYPLSLKLCHPRSALLAFARVEVGIEQCKIFSVFVEHLVGFHIWVIYWYLLIFAECDVVEPCGKSEHSVDNLAELKIRAQHLGIDVVFFQLQLVAVIRAVPWLHLEVIALHFCSELFHFFALLFSCGLVGVDELVEQLIHVARVACHPVFQYVVGVCLES